MIIFHKSVLMFRESNPCVILENLVIFDFDKSEH